MYDAYIDWLYQRQGIVSSSMYIKKNIDFLECVSGTFGNNCSRNCHCVNQPCDPKHGTCPVGDTFVNLYLDVLLKMLGELYINVF
jgi:hypothetical protein